MADIDLVHRVTRAKVDLDRVVVGTEVVHTAAVVDHIAVVEWVAHILAKQVLGSRQLEVVAVEQ